MDSKTCNIYCHAVLKTAEGKYIMQSRGYNLGIHNPGGLSLFGGGLEGEETPWECLARELFEEIELVVHEEEAELLWCSEGISPDKKTPAKRYIYLLKDIDPTALVLHEGDAIVVLTYEEILAHPSVPPGLVKRFQEYAHRIT